MMLMLLEILAPSTWIKYALFEGWNSCRSAKLSPEIAPSITRAFFYFSSQIFPNFVFTTALVPSLHSSTDPNLGLSTDKMEQIAYITPNLSTLQLSYCGRLADQTLETIVSRLHSLKHLILTGPFLVTAATWRSILEKLGSKLQTFEVSDTARWGEECSAALVKYCPNIQVVGLKRIHGLSDAHIRPLAQLRHLRSLDLSEPSSTVTDDAVIPVIQSVGPNLEKLVLDRCTKLGDSTMKAIFAYCCNVTHLSLALLENVTDDCVTTGFSRWNDNHGLVTLNLTRCIQIKNTGLEAMLIHSGRTLQRLSVNSLEELTAEVFDMLGAHKIGVCLVDLDVGFIRCVTDAVVAKISIACPELRVLKVFGDNYVTSFAAARPGVRLIGREDFL
jgi:DNA repair protein RAD7